MDFILDNLEARVLGALIEKDVTTPDYYPLSLNALVNACNQKNNRDPVMELDEEAVRRVLDSLQQKRLAGPAGGADSRVTYCVDRRRRANCAAAPNACFVSRRFPTCYRPCNV